MSRLPFLIGLAGLAATPFGLRAADDAPKALVVEAIKAHGGEEALTKHKAGLMKGKGKITIPSLGESEFTQDVAFMLPDKFRESLELTIAGKKYPVETRVSGDTISITASGTAVEATEPIKKAVKIAQHAMRVARLAPVLQDKGFELAAFGESKVEDKPADGVRVTMKGQPDILVFLDKKTHLLAKMEYRTIDAMSGAEVTEERICQEYLTEKGSIPRPTKILLKRDGKTFMQLEVLEVKNLDKLDDSEFKK